MKIEKIMKDIAASSTYRKEVGTCFQLGFPRLTLRGGELFAAFYPHIERYAGETVRYYLPQYELEYVYPFRHLVLFRNLCCLGEKPGGGKETPACQIPVRELTACIPSVQALFSLADAVIRCREEKSGELESFVRDYQRQYFQTAASMGLQGIYGGDYDSHSCL